MNVRARHAKYEDQQGFVAYDRDFGLDEVKVLALMVTLANLMLLEIGPRMDYFQHVIACTEACLVPVNVRPVGLVVDSMVTLASYFPVMDAADERRQAEKSN